MSAALRHHTVKRNKNYYKYCFLRRNKFVDLLELKGKVNAEPVALKGCRKPPKLPLECAFTTSTKS